MLKTVILITGVLLTTYCSSQTTLSFCTAVNPSNGYCVFDNTKFITSPDSTQAGIYMLVKNPKGFGSEKITFKIFSVDKKTEETYSHSLTMNVQKEWDASWQPEVFNSPGTYLIKVYNDADLLIGSKSFELIKY